MVLEVADLQGWSARWGMLADRAASWVASDNSLAGFQKAAAWLSPA